MVEAVGVPDGHGDLSDADAPRIAEPRPRERRRAKTQHGKVAVNIATDDHRAERPAVRQRRGERRAAVDDVVVRQHEAVRREDYAGAAGVRCLDADHGRADRLDAVNDGLGIGVEQLDIRRLFERSAGGHGPMLAAEPGPRITQTGGLRALSW